MSCVYIQLLLHNAVLQFLVLTLQVVGAYEDMRSYQWSPMLNWDFGTPVGFGSEISPGAFLREWSNAQVVLNCNTYISEITMRHV